MTTEKPFDIVVLSPSASELEFLCSVLGEQGERVTSLSDPTRLLDTLAERHCDVVFLSLDYPRNSGLALVHHVGALHQDVSIVVMSGAASLEAAAQARALGAKASLVTPLSGDDVLVVVGQLRETVALKHQAASGGGPAVDRRRHLAVMHRGQELLRCEEVGDLVKKMIDSLVEDFSAEAAGVWISYPEEPGRLVCEAQRGLGQFAYQDLAIDQHPLGPMIAMGNPFVPEGALRQLWMPIGNGNKLLGLAVVEKSFLPSEEVRNEEISLAEILSSMAAVALHSIRRLRQLEQGGIKDPHTSAYTFAYFADLAGREIEMAKRHNRRFSVATLAVENQELVDSQLRPDRVQQLSERLVEIALGCLRDSDVIARVEGNEFCILLPETGNLGALRARRRLLEALHRDAAILALEAELPLALAVGVATYPNDGKNLGRVMQVSTERRKAHRRSPLGRMHLWDAPFWTSVNALVGELDDYRDTILGEPAITHRLAKMDNPLGGLAHVLLYEREVRQIAHSLIQEAAKRGGMPGVCYVHAGLLPTGIGGKFTGTELKFVSLRPSGNWPEAAAGITEIPVDDARLEDYRFLLFQGETQWYGLIARLVEGDLLGGIHLSDLTILDELITRLQDAYHLQRGPF